MRNVARKGDPTSTGGMIQDGDNSWLSEGAPTTYIGMVATCSACKVGDPAEFGEKRTLRKL